MKANQKKINKRAIMSIGLFLSLLMLPVSAILVHVSHGLPVNQIWLHIHVLFGVLFTVCGIWHAVINWRALKQYLAGK